MCIMTKYKENNMEKLKELARQLDKSEYGFDLTDEQKEYCKENGIVVVFGCSDDLMEFRGAIYDEFDCWEGYDLRSITDTVVQI